MYWGKKKREGTQNSSCVHVAFLGFLHIGHLSYHKYHADICFPQHYLCILFLFLASLLPA